MASARRAGPCLSRAGASHPLCGHAVGDESAGCHGHKPRGPPKHAHWAAPVASWTPKRGHADPAAPFLQLGVPRGGTVAVQFGCC